MVYRRKSLIQERTVQYDGNYQVLPEIVIEIPDYQL